MSPHLKRLQYKSWISSAPFLRLQCPHRGPLRQHLEEIAAHHGGTVPFHGRLFAQWMHHAYPRECSYPHMSGTLLPRTPTEYYKQTNENPAAAKEVMQEHIDSIKRLSSDDQDDFDLPWTQEEELFVSRMAAPKTTSSRSGFAVAMRSVVGLAAIFAVTLTLVRQFVSAKNQV